MGQSRVHNLIHLVYSTKQRKLWIPGIVAEKLYAYQAGIFKALDCGAIAIGGVEDHVHALFALSKNIALKDVVQEAKKGSSKWMKTALGSGNPEFTWQGGYGAFSVSHSNLKAVQRYIDNQAEHHRKVGFQDELRILFARHEIEFDERYVWD